MRPLVYRTRQIGAAITISAIALLLAPGAQAAPLSPTPVLEEELSAKITAESETVLAPEQSFLTEDTRDLRLDIQLTNTSEDPLPAQQIRILLDRNSLTLAEELTSPLPLEGGLLGTPIATVDLPEAGPQATVTTQVDLRGSSFPFTQADLPGVYLLRVLSGSEVTSTAPLVWRGPSETSSTETQTPLSLIVPLTLPENITSLPRRDQLTTLMSPGGTLDSLLNEAITARATLAVDPRIIAGVRAYGSDIPAVATEWLERLRTADLPMFALQFSDADLSTQAQAGRASLLVPSSLSFVTRFGTFPNQTTTPGPTSSSGANSTASPEAAPAETEGQSMSTPSQSPESTDGPVLDDLTTNESDTLSPSDLSEWNYSLTNIAWPALNTVNHMTLDFLKDQGFSTVLLSSSNVQLSPETALAGTENEQTIIRLHQPLMTAASAVLAASTEPEQRAAESRLVAELALVNASAPSQPIALALDRALIADALAASSMVAMISDLPWLSHAELPKEGAATTALITRSVAQERLTAITSAEANVPLVSDTSAVLVEPEYLTGLQTMRLLHFYRAGLTEQPEAAAIAAEAYMKRDEETIVGLTVESSATTQLIGSRSRVPVLVHNLLPFDASVSTFSSVSTPTLSVDQPHSLPSVVPGDSETNLFVPVTARVSSGETTLQVQLLDRNEAVVAFGDLPITVRSTWESLALGALGSVVALFFGLGIWRSLRSRRDRAAKHPGE